MNLQELKAHCYDCLVNIELWQKELKATNEAISKFKEAPKEEVKEEKPKKK